MMVLDLEKTGTQKTAKLLRSVKKQQLEKQDTKLILKIP